MSVDVSPDGRTLVFDLLGDIYSLPIAGGKAAALTSGPAYDTHPRFSPDGKTIAFTSDRGGIENLWLMDADGKNPRALTSEKDSYVRSAAWTPDGNYLIARKEDGKRGGIPPVELWMYHREGGGGIKLTSSDELNNAGGAAVSRDGKFIYYSARQRRFDYVPNLSDGLWQIWRYDRVLAQSFPVVEGFGGAVRPAVSPDGKTLVFVSRRDDDTVLRCPRSGLGLEAHPRSGRDARRGRRVHADGPVAQLRVPARRQVSRLLEQGQDRAARHGVGRPPEHPVHGGRRAVGGAARGLAGEGRDGAREGADPPLAEPVARRALDRLRSAGPRLSAGNRRGRNCRRAAPPDAGRHVASRREYAPAFSPDGKWIAYVSWSDAGGGHVWKAPASPGSSPVKLTRSAGHYANPAWSPKGDRIAVLRGSGLEFRGHQPEEEEFFEAGVLDAAGGDPAPVVLVKLANAMKFHPQVFWSADGTRLYYRDPVERKKPADDPKNDLVSVRLDGSDHRRLLRFPAVDDIVPSPDEQWVVFTSRDNVFVAALPGILTKEPPEVSLKESGVPVYKLSDDAGGFVRWAEGGKTITWSLGSTFFRLPLQRAIEFAREERRKAEEKSKAEAAAGKDAEGAAKSRRGEEGRGESSGAARAEGRDAGNRSDGAPRHSRGLVSPSRRAGRDHEGQRGARERRRPRVGQSHHVDRALRVSRRLLREDVRRERQDDHSGVHRHARAPALLRVSSSSPEAKWEYIANLAYGVTTVYDPSAPSLDVFAQGEQVEAGLMVGPRVYSSGDVLYGGQQEDIFAEVNNLEDARQQVRRMKAYGARMIKVYQQPRRSQRMYFAEACREEHMLLTAEGAGEFQTDMSMALDGFTAWEHALPVDLARTSWNSSRSPARSTRRRSSWRTAGRGASSTSGRRRTRTTTRS